MESTPTSSRLHRCPMDPVWDLRTIVLLATALLLPVLLLLRWSQRPPALRQPPASEQDLRTRRLRALRHNDGHGMTAEDLRGATVPASCESAAGALTAQQQELGNLVRWYFAALAASTLRPRDATADAALAWTLASCTLSRLSPDVRAARDKAIAAASAASDIAAIARALPAAETQHCALHALLRRLQMILRAPNRDGSRRIDFASEHMRAVLGPARNQGE